MKIIDIGKLAVLSRVLGLVELYQIRYDYFVISMITNKLSKACGDFIYIYINIYVVLLFCL